MSRVIANRDRTKTLLSSYTYRETVGVALTDRKGEKTFEFSGIFRWTFMEDGTSVRFPVELNGDILSDEEKDREREKWIENIRENEDFQSDQFNDNRDLFLNCPFDPENYFFAGFEMLKDRNLVKVEYYPEIADDPKTPMDKILRGAVVTLWIDPDLFQILRIRMEGLNLDIFKFLTFFVTIDEAALDMALIEIDPRIWLPSSLVLSARVVTFDETRQLQFQADYDDYGKFTVSSTIEFK